MSVKIMSHIWNESPYEGGTLLVLLALADWSNDDGWCWPSIPSLAKKARLEERQVKRIIKKLEAGGAVNIEHSKGRNSTNRYRVIVTKCPVSFIPEKVTSITEKVSPMTPDPLDRSVTRSVNTPLPPLGRGKGYKQEPKKEPAIYGELLAYLEKRIGPVPYLSKEKKALEWLVANHTEDQLKRCLDYQMTVAWRDTTATWQTVIKGIKVWVLRGEPAVWEPHHNGNGNGHKPPERMKTLRERAAEKGIIIPDERVKIKL